MARVLAVVADLMFHSKLREAARAAGADLDIVRRDAPLVERVRAERPALLLLDLNARSPDPVAAAAAIRADPDLAGVRVVGFVSHVDDETIARARAAGLDEVLARSAFVKRLPELLEAASAPDP